MEEGSEENLEKDDIEASENLLGFFELAFRVAIREGIDIGQFEKNEEN